MSAQSQSTTDKSITSSNQRVPIRLESRPQASEASLAKVYQDIAEDSCTEAQTYLEQATPGEAGE